MTKADLVKQISNQTGIEKVDVREVIEAFCKQVSSSVAQGENVYFRGFGSFIHKKQLRKVARHVNQNTALIIEPHYRPAFRPSKSFIAQVRDKLKVS